MLRHAGSGPYKSTMKYDNIALVSYDKETKFTSVGAEKYSTTHAALSTENEIKFEDEDTSLLFFVTQISETGGDKFSIEASTEEKVFGKTSTHKKFLNDLEKKVQVENEGFTLRVIYNTIVAPTTAKAKNKSEEKPSILTKDSLFGICLSKEQRRSPLVIDHPSELSVVFTDISDKETTTITSGKNGRVATFPKAAVSTKATSEVLDARLADDQYYISSKARLSAFPHSSSSSFSFTDVTPMSYSVLGGDDDDDFYKETTSTKSKLAVLSTQGL